MALQRPGWISPQGRISRATYWLHYVLPLAAPTVAVYYLFPRSVGLLVVSGLALLLWLPGAAKRLHDHNGPAWILVIVFPGGVLCVRIASQFGEPRPFLDDRVGTGFLWAYVTVGVAWALLGFFLAFAKGTNGPNRYGPDPLA